MCLCACTYGAWKEGKFERERKKIESVCRGGGEEGGKKSWESNIYIYIYNTHLPTRKERAGSTLMDICI